MTTGLLLIDIQRDYFPGGAFPLVGPDAAAEVASSVLADFRAKGKPVVHVRHVWDAPDATFMVPGTEGIETHHSVAPAGDEPIISKDFPNSFQKTDLHEVLQKLGVDSLVVAGMMSSMCVDASVRAAVDLGYTVTVVHDACAAPDLEFGDTKIPGTEVHAAFMAALGSMIATVSSGSDVVAASR